MAIDWLYPLAGFSVGMIVGLTGVGGGSLMTPLLVLLFGVSPSVAVGTDLLYASITKAGGTVAHGLKGTVDWSITRALATGSIPAAALTVAFLMTFFPEGIGEAKSLISYALGIALLLTAVSLVFRHKVQSFAQKYAPSTPNPRRTFWLTVVTGAILGVLVTLSSVGAGALGVTVLFFLYPSLPAHRIVGSDIAHAVPLTLVAGIGHWLLGSINWGLLGSLLIGSLPGIWIGSQLSSKIPERILRPILAGMLVLIGSKLITTN